MPQSGPNTQLATSFNEAQAKQLANHLSASLLVQKTYGKLSAGDIGPLVDIFISELPEFKPHEIIEAFREHRRSVDDFPTVASIRAILDPQPKFDYAVYQRILEKQRKHEYITTKEGKYLEAYEANAMKGF